MKGLSYKTIFIFIIIILSGYFFIRLADQSQIITTFPLESLNDVSSYMALLYFTSEFGYHEMVYKWYEPEGFRLFETDAPGWYYFTLPIYILVKDVKPATFISLIAIYIIFAMLFFVIGRIEKLSKLETLAFFVLFAFSPMAIGDYVRQMRMPQMFSWVSLLALFAIIFYYKDKKIDWRFLIISPFIALLILSHQLETVIFPFVLVGLFLIKKSFRERTIIILSSIIGVLASSFWLIPFILNSANSPKLEYTGSRWLLEFSGGFQFANIAGIALGVALLAVFALYFYRNKNLKNELLFFSPIIILDILFLTRLVVYLPIIKHVYIDAYMQFFAFFFLLILFKCYKQFNFIKCIMALLPIGFILVSLMHTPWFVTPSQEELNSLAIFDSVNGTYIFAGEWPSPRMYTMALVCYAAIYYPIESGTGWSLSENIEHRHKTADFRQAFLDYNKESFLRLTEELRIDEIISYGTADCDRLKEFGLNFKTKNSMLCLYSVN